MLSLALLRRFPLPSFVSLRIAERRVTEPKPVTRTRVLFIKLHCDNKSLAMLIAPKRMQNNVQKINHFLDGTDSNCRKWRVQLFCLKSLRARFTVTKSVFGSLRSVAFHNRKLFHSFMKILEIKLFLSSSQLSPAARA